MKFDLTTPCKTCPFRADAPPFHLREGRAQGIVESLDGGNTFKCHNTSERNPHHCAGALITLKREHGGFSGALALACAVGWLPYNELDMNCETLSLEEFVERHEESS